MPEIAAAPASEIARKILILRSQRVLLDADLAALYGTTTKRLNEQVRRNQGRFPADFIFRLEPPEAEAVNRSQIATGSQKHRDPRFPPLAWQDNWQHWSFRWQRSTPVLGASSRRCIEPFGRSRRRRPASGGRSASRPTWTSEGQRVLLDADQVVLYETTTQALNQAGRRNIARFPAELGAGARGVAQALG